MGNVSAYILSQHMVLLKSLSLGTFGAVRQGDRLYPEHPGGDSPAPPNLQLILYPSKASTCQGSVTCSPQGSARTLINTKGKGPKPQGEPGSVPSLPR